MRVLFWREKKVTLPAPHLNGTHKNIQAVRRLEAVTDRLEVIAKRWEDRLDKMPPTFGREAPL